MKARAKAWWQKHWESATLAMCAGTVLLALAVLAYVDFVVDGMW